MRVKEYDRSKVVDFTTDGSMMLCRVYTHHPEYEKLLTMVSYAITQWEEHIELNKKIS